MEESVIIWKPWSKQEEKLTRAFSDRVHHAYLADMIGDSFLDVVPIRNREVRYWPNLDYDHFDAKVTMDNAHSSMRPITLTRSVFT